MFSKDPSILTRKEKMDREEEVRALREALIAELDAKLLPAAGQTVSRREVEESTQ